MVLQPRAGSPRLVRCLIARIEDDEQARFCDSLGIPVIDIAGSSSLKLFSQVRNDDYQTGVSGGTYLKSLGSKRIAWCSVDHVHWARERFIGFQTAVRTLGVDPLIFDRLRV